MCHSQCCTSRDFLIGLALICTVRYPRNSVRQNFLRAYKWMESYINIKHYYWNSFDSVFIDLRTWNTNVCMYVYVLYEGMPGRIFNFIGEIPPFPLNSFSSPSLFDYIFIVDKTKIDEFSTKEMQRIWNGLKYLKME